MWSHFASAVLPIALCSNVVFAGGVDPCRSRADCRPGLFCLAPGESPGCGTCFVGDECDSDAACSSYGDGAICERVSCACQPICTLGCLSDLNCDAGQSCEPDHRCAPRACASDDDCPANFSCVGSKDLRCARKSCVLDADCQGYCVDERCYETLGTCTSMPL